MVDSRTFASRLERSCRSKDSFLCAGLDPRRQLVPREFSPSTDDEKGWAEAYRDFCREVIDLVAPYTAVVKPQSAFFEALGARGVAALEDVAVYAREKHDLLVIGDVKRGDIGSTAAAYAEAFFRSAGRTGSPLFDAVTVNPYMGSDGVLPFLDRGREVGCGVFVLVKTSNPSSSELQDLACESGTLHERTADLVREWGGDEASYSDVGAVVGATHPEALVALRQRMPRSWILIPGVGAQGAGMDDAAKGFDSDGCGALVNMSRGLTYPWSKEGDEAPENWRGRITDAAARAAEDLRSALRERPAS